MIYAMVPASLLVISLIINYESIIKYGFSEKKKSDKKLVGVRFNYFILTASIYLLVDMTWGILYEHHDIPALFPIIYYLTVFYFAFMLFTMLAWTRYMVAYLNRGNKQSKVMLYGVWTMVLLGIVCLVLNRFNRFMFTYNENYEYVGEVGRNIYFRFQIAFYAIISLYMLYVTHKSTGRIKVRYKAVAATSVVLGVSLVMQILWAFLPSYAIGLSVGICLVSSFVNADEKKEKKIRDHIASVMAEDYEAIFYIDIESGEYLTFAESAQYKDLNSNATGRDFFKEALESIDDCVYPGDIEYAKSFYNKETMLKSLEGRKSLSFKYRIMINNEPRFFLFTVMRDKNGEYLILYEKDIEGEIRREKQQISKLKTEKELARRDELTGVKNKTAYKELAESAQGNIDNGLDYLTFALVVCDTNNLKMINDTYGHVAGDEYIKASAKLLCDIYKHSPVFRVGGDEFVVFLRGNVYAERQELLSKLRRKVLENKRNGEGVILASGMSEYRPESDKAVSDIFDRADKEMYEDKQRLKI
ncbi:MAG: GGDEF domain-containing protein [Lachnospiraceae bacterium]|nr:GGDEF domain-containing protein [Lachnospiraceae bacterium]